MKTNIASDKKQYLKGMHRIIHPQKTLDRIAPCMKAHGITRVANITGLDRIGIPVVMVICPNSRALAIAQGKGLDIEAAKASGIMEAIEGWTAENLSNPTVLASYSLMQQNNLNSIFDDLPERYNRTRATDVDLLWIKGRSLFHPIRELYLPYQLVSGRYTMPPIEGASYFCASSNGLASGNNETEALIHALCETIERDAIALWQVQTSHHQ